MLIKRVYEIDPLACPRCGGQMQVIAFIDPPQGEVIEKILRHCGLWHVAASRAPPGDCPDFRSAPQGPPKMGLSPSSEADGEPASSAAPGELTYVDMDTFWATF